MLDQWSLACAGMYFIIVYLYSIVYMYFNFVVYVYFYFVVYVYLYCIVLESDEGKALQVDQWCLACGQTFPKRP